MGTWGQSQAPHKAARVRITGKRGEGRERRGERREGREERREKRGKEKERRRSGRGQDSMNHTVSWELVTCYLIGINHFSRFARRYSLSGPLIRR